MVSKALRQPMVAEVQLRCHKVLLMKLLCAGEVAREAKMWFLHFKVPCLTPMEGRGKDEEEKWFG